MRTRIKTCGVTSAADAATCARLGAHAIGMILWAKSPRLITTQLAAEVVRAIPPFVSRVGVFVDASPAFVAQCARTLPLDYVQLHGSESPDVVRALAGFRVIKAVRLTEYDAWANVELPNLAAILLDSAQGGSGVANDFDAIGTLLTQTPPKRPVIVAGGLRPENVGDVVRRLRPFAVDVSSGIESEPAVKSEARVQAFIDAVQNA